jgi:hypothetical protein
VNVNTKTLARTKSTETEEEEKVSFPFRWARERSGCEFVVEPYSVVILTSSAQWKALKRFRFPT